jgi:hypothetical protein
MFINYVTSKKQNMMCYCNIHPLNASFRLGRQRCSSELGRWLSWMHEELKFWLMLSGVSRDKSGHI